MKNSASLEDQLFQELVALVKKEDSKINLDRLKRAYDFAKKAHEGQFRMSGVPYICHPVEVAKILVDLGGDEDTVIASLLHDVPEDTNYSVEDIQKRFGKHVSALVDALTKLSKVYYRHSMGERQVNSLRKMFLETANDARVVIIKLADRLHNMSTIRYLRPDKQQRIAKETLEIYAPLANLYGIYQLRRELEDLCFAVLQPEEYSRIKNFVHDHERKRSQHVKESIQILSKALKKAGIEAELQGRPKHFYSIYQKSVRDQKRLSEIYDYFAIRIITESSSDCYKALGVAHALFKPKAKRFKDYIALPKPNGYQSLHTTVVGLRGKLTEIQIRSEAMHRDAEFGAASHIYYKGNKSPFITEGLRQLKKTMRPEQFIRVLHDDILQNRIHVFSPTGEIVNLPEGATCLDYVFSVGLPVNTTQFRAIVNNKAYSLIGQLQNGDHIEIVYGKRPQRGPERWWLDHVKTVRAQKSISAYLKKESRESKIQTGSRVLQKELDHESKGPIYKISKHEQGRVAKALNVDNFDQVLEGLGDGTYTSNDVYQLFFPSLELGVTTQLSHFIRNIGKGLGLEEGEGKYRIRIQVDAYDRPGLLTEVVQPIYAMKIPIIRIVGKGYDLKDEHLQYSEYGNRIPMNSKYISTNVIDVDIESHEQLITLFDHFEKIPGVLRAQRVFYRKQIGFFIISILTAAYFVSHFTILKQLSRSEFFSNPFWANLLTYLGFFALFGLLAWLRSLGNKTIPHFEETKYFWPMAFGLTFFSIATVFFDYFTFGLELHLPLLIVFSTVILGFLVASYSAHTRQQKLHLSQLESSHRQMQEREEEL